MANKALKLWFLPPTPILRSGYFSLFSSKTLGFPHFRPFHPVSSPNSNSLKPTFQLLAPVSTPKGKPFPSHKLGFPCSVPAILAYDISLQIAGAQKNQALGQLNDCRLRGGHITETVFNNLSFLDFPEKAALSGYSV